MVTGKVGTDIEDNKCSWIIVQAIKRASPEQLKRLEVGICVNIIAVDNVK